MIKFSKSLAQVALAVSIVSTVLAPVSSLAGRNELCLEAFGGEPAYRQVNPSAAESGDRYRMPNDRGLRAYISTLLPAGLDLRKVLGRNALVVDIGGGQGRAMSDLATLLPVRAVVINTQDFSHLYRRHTFKGSFQFKVGWAEQKLKEFASNTVDMFFDLWGGFAYSPNKVEIIEEVYRALKPGGRAYLLLPTKTPAYVEDPAYNYGQPVSLEWYLKKKYPELVTARTSPVEAMKEARVIEIVKPYAGQPATLDMGLKINEITRRESPASGRLIFNEVYYGVRP